MPPRLPQARGNGCRGATGLPSAQGEPYFPGRLTITHACRKLTEHRENSDLRQVRPNISHKPERGVDRS